MKIVKIKSERIAVRVTPTQKATLAQAAALRGRSLTDFIVDIAHREARQDLERTQIVKLTARGQQQLADLLLNPPELNKALKGAFKAYDKADIISR